MEDILLDVNFDVAFKSGDLVIGESTRQHQQILLLVEKGELREFPARGVGLGSWINDDESGNLNSAIKREYELDGMRVLQVRGTKQKLTIEAIYE